MGGKECGNVQETFWPTLFGSECSEYVRFSLREGLCDVCRMYLIRESSLAQKSKY